jgi:hypothetical protein
MGGVKRRFAFGVAVALLACAAVAAAAPLSPPESVTVTDYMYEFAADGTRLAFPAAGGDSSCNTLEIWNAASGRHVRLPVPRRPICDVT